MGRWIAIGKAPGWDDLAKFTAGLKETSKWRVDPRTTITEVIALADGRMLAECHAHNQADFDAWLPGVTRGREAPVIEVREAVGTGSAPAHECAG